MTRYDAMKPSHAFSARIDETTTAAVLHLDIGDTDLDNLVEVAWWNDVCQPSS